MNDQLAPMSNPLLGISFSVPVLLVLWLCFLASMAALTANPQQLNLKQLHAAQHLWLGSVKNISTGEIEIKQDIKQTNYQLQTATIKSLNRSKLQLQVEYLFPVYQVSPREFEIVPVQVKDQKFYPAYAWTPEIAQRFANVEKSITQGIYPDLNSLDHQ